MEIGDIKPVITQLCQQKAYVRTLIAGRFAEHDLSYNTQLES